MLAIYREHLALIDVLPEPEAKEEEAAPEAEPVPETEAPAAEPKPAEEEIQVTVTDETPAAVEETVIVNTETPAPAAADPGVCPCASRSSMTKRRCRWFRRSLPHTG